MGTVPDAHQRTPQRLLFHRMLALVCLMACVYSTHAQSEDFPLAFQLTSPPSLAGRLMNFLPAAFGGAAVGEPFFTGNVTLFEPLDGCGNYTGTKSLRDTIVLVMRGKCSFGAKAMNANAQSPKMIIIAQCSPSPPYYCEHNLFQAVAGPNTTVSVPVINILYDDATTLSNTIKSNQTVRLQMNGTLAATPADRLALRWFVGNTTFRPGQDEGFDQGGSRSWLDINNPTKDPCTDRLLGLWCEYGRVVSIHLGRSVGLEGPLPDALGRLSALRYIAFDNNRITSVPCAIGQLTNLMLATFDYNHITTVADCFAPLTKLIKVSVSSNRLTAMPASVCALPLLTELFGDDNRLTSLPALNLPFLEVFDFHSNQIAGAVPSFASEWMSYIDLKNNRLSGVLPTDWFDGYAELYTLDLSFNFLQGNLPALAGTSYLLLLDLSYNQFTGQLPATWAQLTFLQSLYVDANQITSPVDTVLGALTTLNQVGFSRNNLTAVLSTDAGNNNDVGAFIALSFPNTLEQLDLSYNQLSSPWQSGWMSALSLLQTLTVAHNRMQGVLPDDIWDAPLLAIFDLSFNDFQGAIPLGEPSELLNNLNLEGNPQLYGLHGLLPTWATFDTTSTKYVKDITSSFICPRIVGIAQSIVLTLDSSYYGYSSCLCDAGTFGTPPQCPFIPVDFVLSANDSMGSGGMVNSFSDGWYGSNRKQEGIDTSWEIDGYALTGQRVYVISIHLQLFRDQLRHFTDILGVYEGDRTLAGQQVYFLRGTHTPELNATVVHVFAGVATVNFRSRDVSGTHFLASYNFSFACPAGYSVQEAGGECHENLNVFVPSPGVQNAVYVMAGVACAWSVFVLGVVVHQRNTFIIKSASKLFCYLMLVFNALMGAGAVFWAMEPTQGFICDLRPWFICLPLVGLLSNLLVKTNRIDSIFGTVFQLRVHRVTDAMILRMSGAMLLVEVVMLGVFSGEALSQAQLDLGSGETSSKLVHQCVSSDGTTIWLVVQFIYLAGFLLWGAGLAWKTRKVPAAFNESSHILNCLVVLVFFSIVIVPVAVLVQSNPDASAIIRGLGQAFAALVINLTLFGPKLYYIFTGHANDKALLGLAKQNSTVSDTEAQKRTKSEGRPTEGAVGGGGRTDGERALSSPTNAIGSQTFTHNAPLYGAGGGGGGTAELSGASEADVPLDVLNLLSNLLSYRDLDAATFIEALRENPPLARFFHLQNPRERADQIQTNLAKYRALAGGDASPSASPTQSPSLPTATLTSSASAGPLLPSSSSSYSHKPPMSTLSIHSDVSSSSVPKRTSKHLQQQPLQHGLINPSDASVPISIVEDDDGGETRPHLSTFGSKGSTASAASTASSNASARSSKGNNR